MRMMHKVHILTKGGQTNCLRTFSVTADAHGAIDGFGLHKIAVVVVVPCAQSGV
jgi:hypothetical protein